jgi:hypothetical protein
VEKAHAENLLAMETGCRTTRQTRPQNGPVALFRRNDRGEIVVRLDTEKTYWSQCWYQFAHDICHVLCGFNGEGDGEDGIAHLAYPEQEPTILRADTLPNCPLRLPCSVPAP